MVRTKKRFSPRRQVLLAVVAALLAAVAWLHFTGAAGTSGIPSKDMDWNGDGTVSEEEIFQSFYAVTVEKKSEGPRECRSYAWRSDGRPIRVDCRTTVAEPTPAEPESP